MRRLKVAVAVLALALSAAGANAATLYVSTSGNDANTGTSTAPFRTINKAASVAKPGDIVNVRGGIYNAAVTISSQGTSSGRIVFRSYPGETAVIDGTGLAAGTILVNLYKTAYVDLSGFEIRNAPYIAVNARGTKFTRITGNDIHHAVRNGIYASYDTMGVSSDLTVDGNSVHNNVLENQNHTMAGGWAGSIVVAKTDRASITRNHVWQNDGEGIISLLSNNAEISRNELSDNFSVGLYFDNARYATADSNMIYSTGNSRYYRDGYPAIGIGVANESYTESNPSSDLTITNNIVVNSRWGFYYGNFENGGGLKNTLVANNTFHKAAQEILRITSDTHSNSVVENNIFSNPGASANASYAGGGVTFRSNNWYGVNAGTAAGTGDVIGDPQFVNAGGTVADDYKTGSLSIAIHKAVDESRVTTDYFGQARTPSYDIGAFESGDSTPLQLLAPTGVTATSSGSTSAIVTWTASASTGVTGYKVYRDGALRANVSSLSFTDGTVAAGATYRYEVTAVDASGNESPRSTAAYVTIAGAAGDTQAPSAPSGLTSTGATSSSVSLRWNASSDNVGVTGYQLYRNGVRIATVSGTSATDQGLASSTTYSYYVVAVDAAGNASAKSNTISVKTPRATRNKTYAAGH